MEKIYFNDEELAILESLSSLSDEEMLKTLEASMRDETENTNQAALRHLILKLSRRSRK
ncbi:hypothetical protein [Faecalispora jeddahensis]|uniref:hypothetical protein n=1 Tax=Faecalispora jeddahensis TaxID=1414721 RepID=UPI0004B60AED|nr:hypothetical protein [Faecalispora jeddahensis]